MLHDVLVMVGAAAIFGHFFGWEVDALFLTAVLTVVGFSVHDSIVVFDRIRENLKLMRREKLSDIVNKSINQTLSRTILTAGLTFLTVLALYLFGGEVLHGFSFALVIGIIIGTYSSIAIAAPILVAYQDWRGSRKRPQLAAAAKETARREKVKA
jgi:preprotein translocase subunit SecF